MRKLAILAVAILLVGCESLDSVPQSAAEASVDPNSGGQLGVARSEAIAFFKGVDFRTAYLAGREGLEGAGFTIHKSSMENGAIIGEHEMTFLDWNIVAGVYLTEEENGTAAKIVVQRSKDLGTGSYKTGGNWPKRILMGMRIYILDSSKSPAPSQ